MRSRRIIVTAAAFVGLVSGGTAAHAIVGNGVSSAGEWGCVVVRSLNQGLCVSNPLPERLPAAQSTTVPV